MNWQNFEQVWQISTNYFFFFSLWKRNIFLPCLIKFRLWSTKTYVFFSNNTSTMIMAVVQVLIKVLTHCSPVLLFHTSCKQKTFSLNDVFRGYRKATPSCNGLILETNFGDISCIKNIMKASAFPFNRNISCKRECKYHLI